MMVWVRCMWWMFLELVWTVWIRAMQYWAGYVYGWFSFMVSCSLFKLSCMHMWYNLHVWASMYVILLELFGCIRLVNFDLRMIKSQWLLEIVWTEFGWCFVYGFLVNWYVNLDGWFMYCMLLGIICMLSFIMCMHGFS